jgi:hypothetical protein
LVAAICPLVGGVLVAVDGCADLAQVAPQLDLSLPLWRDTCQRHHGRGEDRHQRHDDEHLDKGEAALHDGGDAQPSHHLLNLLRHAAHSTAPGTQNLAPHAARGTQHRTQNAAPSTARGTWHWARSTITSP